MNCKPNLKNTETWTKPETKAFRMVFLILNGKFPEWSRLYKFKPESNKYPVRWLINGELLKANKSVCCERLLSSQKILFAFPLALMGFFFLLYNCQHFAQIAAHSMNLEQEQTTYSAKAVKMQAAEKNHVIIRYTVISRSFLSTQFSTTYFKYRFIYSTSIYWPPTFIARHFAKS